MISVWSTNWFLIFSIHIPDYITFSTIFSFSSLIHKLCLVLNGYFRKSQKFRWSNFVISAGNTIPLSFVCGWIWKLSTHDIREDIQKKVFFSGQTIFSGKKFFCLGIQGVFISGPTTKTHLIFVCVFPYNQNNQK